MLRTEILKPAPQYQISSLLIQPNVLTKKKKKKAITAAQYVHSLAFKMIHSCVFKSLFQVPLLSLICLYRSKDASGEL